MQPEGDGRDVRQVGGAPVFPWREILVAILLAVVANCLVRLVAVAAFDVNDEPAPLSFQAIIFWTVIFVAIAGVVWNLVRARAQQPRQTYRLIAVVVLALSLIPDLLLDISWGGRITLMSLHVATAAICVACFTGSPSANARGPRQWRAPVSR